MDALFGLFGESQMTGVQTLALPLALFVLALLWMLYVVMRLMRHALPLRQTGPQPASAARLCCRVAESHPGSWLLPDGERLYCGTRLPALLDLETLPERIADLSPRTGGITAETRDRLLALSRGEVGSTCLRFKTRSGRILQARRGVPAPGDSGDGSGAMPVWISEAGGGEDSPDATVESLSVLQSVLATAPFPVWFRNRDLELVYVNDAYVRAVEAASRDDVLERQIDIVTNALTGSSREQAARLLGTGAQSEERHFAVLAGQRRALGVWQADIGDRIVGFALDLTEAEEARGEVARLLDAHSETLNKLSSPVAIFDSDQRLSFSNSAFARMFRLSEDWLEEKPDHASLLESMREKRRLPEQADFRAWKKQQLDLHHALEPVEELWHLPDGTMLRMVAQPHPLGGLLLLFEDVTNSLTLESNYNTLIAVQRETLNNLHEAVAVFGSDGRLKLYNPNYATIWSLEPGFLDGEPHFADILEQSRPLLHIDGDWGDLKARLLAQITERIGRSGRWHRPDGRVLDYALVPLPDGRMLTTHVDITDSFRIEHALRERNEALETADRLKSEFVANMSYELRTPLNSIIGFSELLEKGFAGPLVEKQASYVGFVISAAGQLRDLIDDILDLAVIEAGAMTLDIVCVPVSEIIESAASLIREQARKAGLRLEIEVADDAGSIEADQRRLTQAIYNLVANAVKFTPRGGSVVISARALGENHLEISVSDTGIGIADEERSLVFKKFHTGSASANKKGVGLGLSLVQSFIELHRGSVELSSIPDQGTDVTCILPRRQPVLETAETEEAN